MVPEIIATAPSFKLTPLVGLYWVVRSVLMLFAVEQCTVSAGSQWYQLVVATGRPLRDIELIVTALLPVFCTAKAVTELLFALLTQTWVLETLIDSDCVLVWNMLPPKKITPAPRTTDAIRIIRVVITFPIPLRF